MIDIHACLQMKAEDAFCWESPTIALSKVFISLRLNGATFDKIWMIFYNKDIRHRSPKSFIGSSFIRYSMAKWTGIVGRRRVMA